MMVALSDRELVGVWGHMRGRVWGNNEDTLLNQEELWRVLGLDGRFAALEKDPSTPIDALSTELRDYDLSYGAITLLRAYLSTPGQPMAIGMVSAKALRRIG